MSADIRSFFKPKTSQKSVVKDDDDIPESPNARINNKKIQSRKKRILSDDSDEEMFSSKKKKPSDNKKTQSKNKNTSKQSTLKEVKVADIFGSTPIKRTEPIIKKEKKKTETGIHSDDDFDKSLFEIDAFEEMDIKNNETKANDIKHKTQETDTTKETNKKEKIKVETSKKNEIKSYEQKKYNKRDFSEFTEIVPKLDVQHDSPNKKKKLNHSNNESIVKINDKSPKIGNKDEEAASDDTIIENYDEPKIKKDKFNKSLNESVLTDEERHERRMHSAALYQKYLNRSGPKHLGSKEIPEGTPNCLMNCAFLLTGVLNSFEREEIIDGITKYGGCVKNSISKKVTHVLAGEDAGPAKMSKAQELGIKIINEDEFLKMIADSKTKTHKNEVTKDIQKEKTPAKKSAKKSRHEKNNKDDSRNKLNGNSLKYNEKTSNKYKSSDNDFTSNRSEIKHKLDEDNSKHNAKNESKVKTPNKSKDTSTKDKSDRVKHEEVDLKPEVNEQAKAVSKTTKEDKEESHRKHINGVASDRGHVSMWVEKYKPQNVKQIIGQHGEASNVKKLSNWLTKWYGNRKVKIPKPSPWAKNDDGAYYKAALLSGPPGVGKTTTVALVCKELGFDTVEFNASDTRNKTLIREQIGELLITKSLSAYAQGETGKQAVSKKHVLVMDEVDGMAGNEDRGGLQELIGLIKSTSVPIICMCNDRNSQKMRSFINYCYDLRFNRPRVDQIKSAMMSICFKEGIKIPQDALSQLIVASNQDVRQTMNLLSMWSADSDPNALKRDANTVKKDIKLGPWEAVRKVFSAEDHKHMSINDKSDLFFYDYNLAPLFVQENYLQVAPHCPKREILMRMSKAADSISVGDLVSARIRGGQAWGLLPVQAMYSSVIPGHHMSGHVTGQIQFPGWLGKNSRANKMHRLCQEIHAHTRLSTSGSKSSIYLDYSSHLRDAIINPLIADRADGIDRSMQVLESYHLLREDLDSLTELSLWPGQRNPMILVDSKVKAAMTRTYNKKATALPYAPVAVHRGRAKEEDEDDNDEGFDDDDQDNNPENDALIKKKKSKEPAPVAEERPSTSKQVKGKKKK